MPISEVILRGYCQAGMQRDDQGILLSGDEVTVRELSTAPLKV